MGASFLTYFSKTKQFTLGYTQLYKKDDHVKLSILKKFKRK